RLDLPDRFQRGGYAGFDRELVRRELVAHRDSGRLVHAEEDVGFIGLAVPRAPAQDAGSIVRQPCTERHRVEEELVAEGKVEHVNAGVDVDRLLPSVARSLHLRDWIARIEDLTPVETSQELHRSDAVEALGRLLAL